MRFKPPGYGWHVDLPDAHDYGPSHDALLEQFDDLSRLRGLGPRVDLRDYFEEAEHQQGLNSSTAHACAATLEYFESRSTGRRLDLSRAFIYAMSRRTDRVSGDGGASLRTTWKSIVRFGSPPDRYWPYSAEKFDEEPSPFLYGFARDYSAVTYVRLDQPDMSCDTVLKTLQSFLAAGFPCVFGFPIYSSMSDQPDIVLPGPADTLLGGQAVVAIGYDDSRRIASERGGLLVRNSWGNLWGDGGCGWIPYAYIRKKLARDFWTVVKAEWLSSGEFLRPEIPRHIATP